MGLIFNLLTFFVSLIFIVITIVVGLWMWSRIKGLPPIDIDTKVRCFLPQFSHGHAEGLLLDIVHSSKGRSVVSFYATDPSRDELERSVPLVERVVVEKLHVVPRGKNSKSMNLAYIIPRDAVEIADMLSGTILKKGFVKGAMYAQMEGDLMVLVKEHNLVMTELVKYIQTGDLSRILLAKVNEYATNLPIMPSEVKAGAERVKKEV